MDSRLRYCLRDCDYYTRKLKAKINDSREELPNCMKGELLREYEKAYDLAEMRVQKINVELHKLQDCLEVLDIQQSM